MLLLLQGWGVASETPALVTGKRKYVEYKLRDKRVKIKLRDKRIEFPFRDKRRDNG